MGNENGLIQNKPKTREECTPRDTTTAYGTHVTYIRQERGGYRIGWSGKGFERVSDSLYDCFVDEAGVWDFIPKVFGESGRYMLLKKMLYTSSAASAVPLEYSLLLLPKNQKGKVAQLDYFIKLHGDYVLYADEDFTTLHLMHLNSGTIRNIKMVPFPILSRSPTIPIRETGLKNGILTVEYQAEGKNHEPVNTKIRIKVANHK